ncbi:MAG: hypothetical protein HKO02_08910 [Hyphomonadaceae bacterium]|nr:hypothetical protein [Hyphomonadaceae bacterium]
MLKRLKKMGTEYTANESGNMMMMVGVSLTVFMLCGAMVTDVSLWRSQQDKLQNAADSAALAGAIVLSGNAHYVSPDDGDHGDDDYQSEDEDDPDYSRKREAKITARKVAREANDTTLEGYKSKIVVNPKTDTVSVDLTVGVPRMFSAMFMKADPSVKASAVATVVHRDDLNCIYIMDPAGDQALKLDGQGTLMGPSCGIQVQSTSATALVNGTSASIHADRICVAGGYTGSGYQPTPNSGCSIDPDPFAKLNVPAGGSCTHTNYMVTASETLYPGTYCGGIQIGNDFAVNLAPGRYYIRDGNLKMTNNASLTGDRVVFILDGDSSIDSNSTGKFVTTPPVRGPLKGFSVVERSPAGNNKSKITGNGSIDFTGTIYTPSQIWELTGKSDGNSHTPSYGSILAYRLKVTGKGNLNISPQDTGAKVKETVRLVK